MHGNVDAIAGTPCTVAPHTPYAHTHTHAERDSRMMWEEEEEKEEEEGEEKEEKKEEDS